MRRSILRRCARTTGPLPAWEALVASGALQHDAQQLRVATELQRIHVEFARWKPATVDSYEPFVYDLGGSLPDDAQPLGEPQLPPPLPPRGLYIHGSVGSGKSMLMDLFFDQAVVGSATGGSAQRGKRRTHFQPFLDECLETLHDWRGRDDAAEWHEAHSMGLLRGLAKAFAKENALLCFDEVQLPDPASAALMQRLLFFLLQHGVVLVATSNRAPAELHAGGVVPSTSAAFADFLAERCAVRALEGADYRAVLARAEGASSRYFTPLGSDARAAMDARWDEYCAVGAGAWAGAGADADASPAADARPALRVYGRPVATGRTSPCGRGARFDFAELCGSSAARGPADFLCLARHFDSIFVDGIPELARSMASRNEARRLIWLVDALYVTCDGNTCPRVNMTLCLSWGWRSCADLCDVCTRLTPLSAPRTQPRAFRASYRTRRSYEARTTLVASAATSPERLFTTRDGAGDADDGVILDVVDDVMLRESLGSLTELRFASNEEASDAKTMQVFTGADDVFSFERCSSRILEMTTAGYGASAPRASGFNSIAPRGGFAIPSAPPPPPPPPREEGEDEEGVGEIAGRHHAAVDIRVAPKFSDRHFYKLGRWGGRAAAFGRGDAKPAGPRMGGPSPLEIKLERLRDAVAGWWRRSPQ